MQPYHVPSIIALKKRVKQFHNELKTHSTESVSLGWSRDFTARMLHWDDWNALYKAHDKPLSEDGHRYKLFSRRFVHTYAEIKDLQAASRNVLREEMPSLSYMAIDACIKKLWYLRETPLQLPANNKVSAGDIPDEYWLDNTYINSESEGLYLNFICEVIAPVVARNGGVLVCNENDYQDYYRALSLHAETIHVLDMAAQPVEYLGTKAQPLQIVFDDGDGLWAEFHYVWFAALDNARIDGSQINLSYIASAITVYYKMTLGDAISLNSLHHSLMSNRDFGKLPELLKGEMGDSERELLTELDRIVNDTALLSIGHKIRNALNAIMDWCGERGKADQVTVDALREMKTPIIIVAPDPMYNSSSNGYIAGIIDLIFVKLRNYGHSIQPTGNAYDSRPPRLLATPYNARFAPRGMGITCISNTPAGWGVVSGGHPDVNRWNRGVNDTCVATYIANVGNHFDIDEVPRRFFRRPRKSMTWYSHRHPLDPEKMNASFFPEDKRKAGFYAISVTM